MQAQHRNFIKIEMCCKIWWCFLVVVKYLYRIVFYYPFTEIGKKSEFLADPGYYEIFKRDWDSHTGTRGHLLILSLCPITWPWPSFYIFSSEYPCKIIFPRLAYRLLYFSFSFLSQKIITNLAWNISAILLYDKIPIFVP